MSGFREIIRRKDATSAREVKLDERRVKRRLRRVISRLKNSGVHYDDDDLGRGEKISLLGVYLCCRCGISCAICQNHPNLFEGRIHEDRSVDNPGNG